MTRWVSWWHMSSQESWVWESVTWTSHSASRHERTIKGILEGEISFPHRGGASLALVSRETGLLLLQLTHMSLNIRAAWGPDCVLLSFHVHIALQQLFITAWCSPHKNTEMWHLTNSNCSGPRIKLCVSVWTRACVQMWGMVHWHRS